jgi:nitrogen PTS system EIIA component
MTLTELISPHRVFVGLRVGDKKQLLQDLSRRSAELLKIQAQPIFDALQAREELGSTGLGQGFALPHARLEGLSQLFGLFARLSRPIEFQAVDEKPVDLVFLLLIPNAAGNDHVAALAAISRRLREPEFAARLRKAQTAAAVYELLASP